MGNFENAAGPHSGQQHAGLQHAVWRPQQEVTRPRVRFRVIVINANFDCMTHNSRNVSHSQSFSVFDAFSNQRYKSDSLVKGYKNVSFVKTQLITFVNWYKNMSNGMEVVQILAHPAWENDLL